MCRLRRLAVLAALVSCALPGCYTSSALRQSQRVMESGFDVDALGPWVVIAGPGSVLVVTVRPEVAEAVLNEQKKVLAELEEQSHRKIFVRADHRLAYEDIEIRAMVALPDEIDHRRA